MEYLLKSHISKLGLSGDKPSIACFGAGHSAKTYIPLLLEYFEIQYIIDSDSKKTGATLHGIEIVELNRKNINAYPIVITIVNYNSIYKSLRDYGCKQKIFTLLFPTNTCANLFIAPIHGVASFSDAILSLKEQAIRFTPKEYDYLSLEAMETSSAFLNNKQRIFNMASPADFDAPGGPCACLRNLYKANESNPEICNFFTLCPSVVIVPKGYCKDSYRKETAFSFSFMDDFIKNNEKVDFTIGISIYLRLQAAIDFLCAAHQRFGFTSNDVFLLQDSYLAYVFVNLFPDFKNVIQVCHLQGTLSNEASSGNIYEDVIYDYIQLDAVKKIHQWVFPSHGALEDFISTATPKIKENMHKCNVSVVYNGYTKKERIHPDSDFVPFLDSLCKYDIVLSSTSYLYRNKGIERVPRVIAYLRDKYKLKVHWVLIGDGDLRYEVETEINANLNPGEYTWYKERFSNQDNVFALFERSDFYIMMHRVSVLDLATLQAMSYHCVPILSNVGGNKELCGYANGLLVDGNDISSLENALHKLLLANVNAKTLDKKQLSKLQKKNSEIVSSYFTDSNFVKGYHDVIYHNFTAGGDTNV